MLQIFEDTFLEHFSPFFFFFFCLQLRHIIVLTFGKYEAKRKQKREIRKQGEKVKGIRIKKKAKKRN